ncbi:hypothetical protein SPI_08633 [Niveomyces insectorum RCEF 264]|uniref:Uncharacterized protein n=1 Tax=Niveomyces insectorum RCEF 264 TaxID=1081102 RepID=A0A167MU97_9HYPO|nr:hypothetical protein SPI_08633 [Niveomyces insectorum RCEF 264]
MSSPPAAAVASRKHTPPAQSTLYKAVMTPVVFVSFLVSLAWPYYYVWVPSDSRGAGAGSANNGDGANNGEYYYHSMQRKLLKMESSEAFRIRTTVLCVMGLAAAGAAWAVVTLAGWAARWLWRIVP